MTTELKAEKMRLYTHLKREHEKLQIAEVFLARAKDDYELARKAYELADRKLAEQTKVTKVAKNKKTNDPFAGLSHAKLIELAQLAQAAIESGRMKPVD